MTLASLPDLECRVAGSADRRLVLSAVQARPPLDLFPGSSSAFHNAYVGRLLNDHLGLFVIAVARASQEPAGYVMCVRDSRRFWLKLLARHPFAAGTTVWRQKRASLLPNLFDGRVAAATPSPAVSPYIWSPSKPENARVIFVGTLDRFRGRGVGLALYQMLATALRSRACEVVEAHIDAGNTASVRLHERAGWDVTQLPGNDYRAVLRLT